MNLKYNERLGERMKLFYDSPEMELLEFLEQDVITSSTTIQDGNDQDAAEDGIDWGQLQF